MRGIRRIGWAIIILFNLGAATLILWLAREPLADRWHRFTCAPQPHAIDDARLFHHALPPCGVFVEIDHGVPEAERRQDGAWKIRVNSLGFRNREFDLAKPAASQRIIILGDSFTFGYGVELADTFFVQLEQRLRATCGHDVEVWNLGVVSWATVPQWAVVRERLGFYDPDLVLLLFDLSDFSDNLAYRAALTPEGDRFASTSVDDFTEERLVFRNRFPNLTDPATPEQLAALNEAFAVSYDYVARIAAQLDAAKVPFEVIFYPYPFIPLDYEQRYLTRFYDRLDAGGIAWHSLYRDFGAKERAEGFQPNNGHWNAEGSRLAADLLHAHLRGRCER